jgi:hypothetical protein
MVQDRRRHSGSRSLAACKQRIKKVRARKLAGVKEVKE